MLLPFQVQSCLLVCQDVLDNFKNIGLSIPLPVAVNSNSDNDTSDVLGKAKMKSALKRSTERSMSIIFKL